MRKYPPQLSRQQKQIALSGAILFVALFATYWFLFRDTTFYPALVNGVPITQETLDEQTSSRVVFFEQSEAEYNEYVVRLNVLNTLIDQRLISTFAELNGISVSQNEIQSFYELRVSSFETEQAFLDEINRLYGTDKQAFLDKIQTDLLRDKVQQALAPTPLSEWLAEQREAANIRINI